MAGKKTCWEWQLKSWRKSYCLDLEKNCLTLRLCSNSVASVHFCGINYINLHRTGNRISNSSFYKDTDFPLIVLSSCWIITFSFLFVREYFTQLAWSHSVKRNVQNKLTEDLTYDNVHVIRRLQIFYMLNYMFLHFHNHDATYYTVWSWLILLLLSRKTCGLQLCEGNLNSNS